MQKAAMGIAVGILTVSVAGKSVDYIWGPALIGRDPVFAPLTIAAVHGLAIAMELICIGYIFVSNDVARKGLLLSWLSAAFLSYRAGLWIVGYKKPCNCLGAIPRMVGISETVAGKLAVTLALCIGILGFGVWLRERRGYRGLVGRTQCSTDGGG